MTPEALARVLHDATCTIGKEQCQHYGTIAEHYVVMARAALAALTPEADTLNRQGQMIRDLTIAADAAEDRAEAAEGLVREAYRAGDRLDGWSAPSIEEIQARHIEDSPRVKAYRPRAKSQALLAWIAELHSDRASLLAALTPAPTHVHGFSSATNTQPPPEPEHYTAEELAEHAERFAEMRYAADVGYEGGYRAGQLAMRERAAVEADAPGGDWYEGAAIAARIRALEPEEPT